MGLVAPRFVGSSWTRDWTRVPCVGRQILYNRDTSKAHVLSFNTPMYQFLMVTGFKKSLPTPGYEDSFSIFLPPQSHFHFSLLHCPHCLYLNGILNNDGLSSCFGYRLIIKLKTKDLYVCTISFFTIKSCGMQTWYFFPMCEISGFFWTPWRILLASKANKYPVLAFPQVIKSFHILVYF